MFFVFLTKILVSQLIHLLKENVIIKTKRYNYTSKN